MSAEERVAHIRARQQAIGARIVELERRLALRRSAPTGGMPQAEKAARDAARSVEQLDHARRQLEQALRDSAQAHFDAGELHEHLAEQNVGDVPAHRRQAAWHREQAAADVHRAELLAERVGRRGLPRFG